MDNTEVIVTVDGLEIIVGIVDIIFLSKNPSGTCYMHLPYGTLYKISNDEYERLKGIFNR